MMRALLIASFVSLSSGSKGGIGLGLNACTLESAGAVDELLDSAVYIWAAANRCGNPGEAVQCEIDISSAVESLNAMANIIVKALSNCGKLSASAGKACGMAAGELTEHVAGLASATGGIKHTCFEGHSNAAVEGGAVTHRRLQDDFGHNDPFGAGDHGASSVSDPHSGADHGQGTSAFSEPANSEFNAPHGSDNSDPAGPSLGSHSFVDQSVGAVNNGGAKKTPGRLQIGSCVVDMKDSFRSLFQVIQRTMNIKEQCKPGSPNCFHQSFEVVGAFTSLGEYLSKIIGHCSGADKETLGNAECASEVLEMVHSLNGVASAGKAMSRVCKSDLLEHHLLYNSEEGQLAENPAIKYVAFALMAILPMSAAMSFFAGVRANKARAQPVVRELESLVQADDAVVVPTRHAEAGAEDAAETLVPVHEEVAAEVSDSGEVDIQ